MWFKSTSPRKPAGEPPLFDDAFLRRMEKLSLQAQRTLRGRPTGGDHQSRHQLPTTVFSDHRPYTEGDDYRSIDWNIYAHTEEVFVKLGEVDQDIAVHMLLDVSRSMTWGRPTKLRAAKQLVGALGYLALAHHDRLRMTLFGATALGAFGPSQGKSRQFEMLRFVESALPAKETNLGAVLTSYARQHERGGLLVVCSDLLAPAGLDEGLKLLAPPRWQVLVLHLLAPEELAPPVEGPVELEDAETGQMIRITIDTEAVTAYRAALDAWQAGIRGVCGRRGATYAQVPTSWPLERQVLPYLRARQIVT